MKKSYLLALLIATTSLTAAGETSLKIAVVDPKACKDQSLIGKAKEADLEKMQKQLTEEMQQKAGQLQKMHEQQQDENYWEGLSAQAQEEHMQNMQTLQMELYRYQQQASGLLNQKHEESLHAVQSSIEDASQKLSKDFDLILNANICFWHKPSFDITSQVIQAMDEAYRKNTKPADSATGDKK